MITTQIKNTHIVMTSTMELTVKSMSGDVSFVDGEKS